MQSLAREAHLQKSDGSRIPDCQLKRTILGGGQERRGQIARAQISGRGYYGLSLYSLGMPMSSSVALHTGRRRLYDCRTMSPGECSELQVMYPVLSDNVNAWLHTISVIIAHSGLAHTLLQSSVC